MPILTAVGRVRLAEFTQPWPGAAGVADGKALR